MELNELKIIGPEGQPEELIVELLIQGLIDAVVEEWTDA